MRAFAVAGGQTRLMNQSGGEQLYKGMIDATVKTVRNEGVLALYKGVGPRISRVCCEVAITMSLYGEVVKVLNKYWITADQIEAENKAKQQQMLRSSSVITELPRQPSAK